MEKEKENVVETTERRGDVIWLLSCVAITGLAFFLRFFWLGLKPFHHDEGVNGWFLTNLFRDGVYKYDPQNYHGPTLYYISLAFAEVFGLETEPVRWSVAIWGVLIVVLAFFLRPYIGRIGALAAAAFLALSPGMVFISRYFIHEIFFVFLSLTIVMSIVFFIDRRKAGPFAIMWTAILLLVAFSPSTINFAHVLAGESGENFRIYGVMIFIVQAVLVFFVMRMLLTWNDGRPLYFLLFSASVALFFATKETAFITLGTMAIAAGLVWFWRRSFAEKLNGNAVDEIDDSSLSWAGFRSAMGTGIDLWLLLMAAGAVFIFLFVLFFSSFFTYAEGVGKAFEAYAIWTKTGSRDHADNGYFAYLEWAWKIEAPILILAALGTAIAFIKARHRFAMFVGLWSLGLFLAYSIIPYKTPWLMLSFLLPGSIVGGYAINALAKLENPFAKAGSIALTGIACMVLAYQTYDLNFMRYDDEEMPYVYAHTYREFLDLVRDIERFSELSGKGNQASVEVVSPDYWPLVWYMKDHPKAIFHGKLIDTKDAEMIITKKRDQDVEATRRFAANYFYVGTYRLRPGVELVLLVRKDVAGQEGKELYRLSSN